jgi:tetratricopeptide (TPR) repeat protein
MKLGEVYLRRGDSANAEVQFATVAQQQPEGPLAEKALFLAGQCASNLLNTGSVDRALAYWDKVAAGKGGLRWKARYQQAAVKSRLGEEAEGAVLFELVVKAAEGVSADLRLAALCGRADALLSLAKRTSAPLEDALAEYRALAEDAEVTPMWRNQALYKMGKALESADAALALQSFDRVLQSEGTVEAGEFFWSYKAGFDAARLHEAAEAWRKAIAVYERLAAMPGPRAQEARSRARQLRLERFIWD